MLRIALFLVAIMCLVFSSLCKDGEKKHGNRTVKIAGKSGKIKIQYNDTDRLEIDFSSIIEKSNNSIITKNKGGNHSFDNFKNLDFDVSDFVSTTYQNLNCSIITMKVNNFVNNGSSITGQIIFFNQSGQVDTGNKTFENVKPGTMKLNLKLEKWPFCNNTNSTTDDPDCTRKDGSFINDTYLDVAIEIKAKKAGKKYKKKGNYTFGDSFVSFSSYFTVDSVLRSMPEEFPNIESKGDKNIINLRFPRFSNVLEWDPIFQVESTDIPDDTPVDPENPNYLWLIILVVVFATVIITAIVYFFCIKGKSERKNSQLIEKGNNRNVV